MNIVQSDSIEKTDIQFTDYLRVSAPDDGSQVAIGEARRKSFKEEIQKIEKVLIIEALQQAGGNISQSARNLDIPQQTLSNKIKKYGLESHIHRLKLLKYE